MKSLLACVALAGLIATAAVAQDDPRHGWMEGHHRPFAGGEMREHRLPMTRAEVEARVTEHFARFDADHDGVITRAELDAFFAKRRVAWEAERKQHRDHMFDRLDKSHDGKISRAEFESPPPPGAHGGHRAPGGPGERGFGGPGRGGEHRPHHGMMARHWFERLDSDHDGRVTLAEARAAALARFDRIDADHDGTLSPDELRAGWMRGRGGADNRRGPGRQGDRPPPPRPPAMGGGAMRGPGYDLPASTPPAPAPLPRTI